MGGVQRKVLKSWTDLVNYRVTIQIVYMTVIIEKPIIKGT